MSARLIWSASRRMGHDQATRGNRRRCRCRCSRGRRCRCHRPRRSVPGTSSGRRTAALTKKDMKPSCTPCVFSNFSPYCLRSVMTGAMFTSLNVVRMALVVCDCSRRSAIRGHADGSSARAARDGRPGDRGAGSGRLGSVPGPPVGRPAGQRAGNSGGSGVFLGHAATAAEPGDVRSINAFFVENLACRGHGHTGRCNRGCGRSGAGGGRSSLAWAQGRR